MADLDKLIVRIVDSYIAAVHAKDVGAFMRLYDPHARIFDMWGVWSYEDAEAWKSNVEGWLNSLGSERVKVTFDDVRATMTKDFAAVSAVITYASVSAQGEQLRSMQNRLSWVLRTSGDELRIIHEHTSAPIGFEDMRAILQR